MSSTAKRSDETWREFVERRASQEGLQRECINYFDGATHDRAEPAAAWEALYEWDVLTVEEVMSGRCEQEGGEGVVQAEGRPRQPAPGGDR